MANTSRIVGLERLIAKLTKMRTDLAKQEAEGKSAVTGFTQRYALIVHEDLNMRHAAGKQAKYLEAPARKYRTEIANVVRVTYQKTKSLPKALLMGALRLQREAQEIVPIDTSALKNSAWTAMEKDVQATSMQAFAKSEAIRLAEQGKRAKKP